LPDQFWLDGTLALMYKCDAALFVEGWKKSSGSRGEHDACMAHVPSIPRLFSLKDLQEWLRYGNLSSDAVPE
jgi:hypothetical protein